MPDDENQGAGQQAPTPSELAARAAEQREREATAFAEHQYDLARQSAAANQDGRAQPHGFGRTIGPPLVAVSRIVRTAAAANS